MSKLSRRGFLHTGLAGGALLLVPTLTAQTTAPAAPAAARRARNVIFLVSDGMSLGTLTMSERFRMRHEGRSTHWIGLYGKPGTHLALIDTASADSPVTDSAAGASAWGCGHKVNNGALNVGPDGQKYPTIMRLAHAAGLGTGLVSTATITHATPAGFTVQVAKRAAESEIASQYLDIGIDVLLGGGSKFFAAAQRPDHRDMAGDFARAGYQVVNDAAGLRAASPSGRLLGTFDAEHLPFSLDRKSDPAIAARVPTLAEMAQVALDRLSARPEGFVLQIEGGRVDHAAHSNDIGGLIYDQLAFDDAVGVAIQFAAGRDDTLVIVTTDHGNANPGLNGSYGPNGGAQECFDRVAHFRHTNVWALAGLGPDSTLLQIRDRVQEATDIALQDDELQLLQHALRNEHREGYRVRNAPLIALGQILANYVSVGWTGVDHTTDFAPLAAFGPGSEPIGGLMQNTDLFGVITRALGLKVS